MILMNELVGPLCSLGYVMDGTPDMNTLVIQLEHVGFYTQQVQVVERCMRFAE